VVEGDPVVVVRADDVGGTIGGGVVDDVDVVVVSGVLREESAKRAPDAVGVVVDGDDDRN